MCEKYIELDEKIFGVKGFHITCHINMISRWSNYSSGFYSDIKRYFDGGYILQPAEYNREDSLLITGKEITITARVTGLELSEEVAKQWQIGFTQTILRSNRTATYESGLTRNFRLDTSSGSLKDGDEDSLFYPSTEEELKTGTSCILDDAPNFFVPLCYKDKKLISTSGCDEFITYCVLVHEKTKSIISLYSINWIVNWDGLFKWSSQDDAPLMSHQWIRTPSSEAMEIKSIKHEINNYVDLRNLPQITPFSLKCDEAEKYFEIETDSGWKSCNSKGKEKNYVRTANEWHKQYK